MAQHPVTPSSRLPLAAYRGARSELPGKAAYHSYLGVELTYGW
jgi:hypothetical protein